MSNTSANGASSVLRWLDLGRDVLVSGDVGSGKSRAVMEVARALRHQGRGVLEIAAVPSASDSAMFALATHESVPKPLPGQRIGAAEVTSSLADVLGGPRDVIIVDDLADLDGLSLSILAAVLRRSGALLVASTPSAEHVMRTPHLASLIGARSMASVGIPSLGFAAVARLFTTNYHAPADASLVSWLTVQSGGIPAVVKAIVDAALWENCLRKVDGYFTMMETPGEAAHDIVFMTLGARLAPGHQQALSVLAWAGMVSAAHAETLVGGSTIAELVRLGRLSNFVGENGEAVAMVSPPAFADALVNRMSAPERGRVAGQVHEVLGETFTAVNERHDDAVLEELFGPHAKPDEDYAQWAQEFTRLARTQAQQRQSAALTMWRQDPSYRNAAAYLERPSAGFDAMTIEEIFETSRPGMDDDAHIRGQFAARQLQWTMRSRHRIEDIRAVAEAGRTFIDGDSALLDVEEIVYVFSLEGIPDGTDLESAISATTENHLVHGYAAIGQATFLMECGQPQRALEVIDLARDNATSLVMRERIEALAPDALILLGRLGEATDRALDSLSRAYIRRDVLSIRLHTWGLAASLIARGDDAGAWRVLSAALRLGSPSPFEGNYYERILAASVIALNRLGDTELARALWRELEQSSEAARPALGSVRQVAQASMLRAEGQNAAADQLLWEKATSDCASGFLASAMLAAVSRTAALTDPEIEELGSRRPVSSLPIFASILELHQAVSDKDAERIQTALLRQHVIVADPLLDEAVRLVNITRNKRGLHPVSASDYRSFAGPLRDRASDGHPRTARADVFSANNDGGWGISLSARERQIASLASHGLSNREIAEQMFLSVRTVENHMYRALQKLGLQSRRELKFIDRAEFLGVGG